MGTTYCEYAQLVPSIEVAFVLGAENNHEGIVTLLLVRDCVFTGVAMRGDEMPLHPQDSGLLHPCGVFVQRHSSRAAYQELFVRM